jgi:hypothetical protein
MKHPECEDILKSAVEQEEAHTEEHYLGWQWHEIHVHTGTLNKLVAERLIRVSYRSANFTHYKLVDLEAMKEALREFEGQWLYLQISP